MPARLRANRARSRAAAGGRPAADLLAALPGPAAAHLDAALVAALPAQTPPPPWWTTGRALLWWHRASPRASDLLPAPLRARRQHAVTLWCVVDYTDTPVGAYREVWVCPVLLAGLPPRLHIPFIAVDSLPSVHGGRAHWSLPKVLGDFTLTAAGRGRIQVSAEDPGHQWRVSALGRPVGPAVPVLGPLWTVQVSPAGELSRATAWLGGWVRPALVAVAGGAAPPLDAALRPGQHPGLILGRARLRVGAPRRPG